MAKELAEKLIDGEKYEFMQFGAKKSIKLLTRLLKVVGEPLSLAVGAANGGGSLFEKQLNPDMLGKAVACLVEHLEEDEVLDLIEEFTGKDNVLYKGMKINFDSHYEGKLPHLFKVLTAALEVQYGNFFGEFIGAKGPGIRNRSTPDLQT
jgi:hypothetical protein